MSLKEIQASLMRIEKYKKLSEDTNDNISSEVKTLSNLVPFADANSAKMMAERLVKHDENEAIIAFHALFENFMLDANSGWMPGEMNPNFATKLERFVADAIEKNGGIKNREYMVPNPEYVRQDEKLKAVGKDIHSIDQLIALGYIGEIPKIIPRVELFKGIHKEMDSLIEYTKMYEEEAGMFDGEYSPGVKEFNLGKLRWGIEYALKEMPSPPPKELKGLLIAAIDTNWDHMRIRSEIESAGLLFEALAKHYGHEPEVQKYFASLYAESSCMKLVNAHNKVQLQLKDPHKSFAQEYDGRANGEKASLIRSVVAKFMPDLLPKQAMQKVAAAQKQNAAKPQNKIRL